MNTDKGPFLVSCGSFKDHRGSVGILEHHLVPFEVRRTFWITQVPDHCRRGGHAHRSSQQFLICVDGTIDVELEGLSGHVDKYQLRSSRHQGLYLPPLYWGHYTFRDAVALCMASDYFDESDYLRDYSEFEKLKYADQH